MSELKTVVIVQTSNSEQNGVGASNNETTKTDATAWTINVVKQQTVNYYYLYPSCTNFKGIPPMHTFPM